MSVSTNFSNAASTICTATSRLRSLRRRWATDRGSHAREREEEAVDPAGTQTGSTFRIKGRGVSKRGGSARGDLYVTVDVIVPTKLDAEQKELLTKLASTIETENKPIQKKILEKVKEIFS